MKDFKSRKFLFALFLEIVIAVALFMGKVDFPLAFGNMMIVASWYQGVNMAEKKLNGGTNV